MEFSFLPEFSLWFTTCQAVTSSRMPYMLTCLSPDTKYANFDLLLGSFNSFVQLKFHQLQLFFIIPVQLHTPLKLHTTLKTAVCK